MLNSITSSTQGKKVRHVHIPAIEQGTSQQMTLGMAHKNNISHNQTALFSPNSCMPAIHHLIVHVLVRMLSRILNHIQQ
jgi:hypothetical protein